MDDEAARAAVDEPQANEMQTAKHLIHWYDVEQRRIACGVPGHSHSTKHHREVTCAACLACVEARRQGAFAPANGPMQ